MGKKTEVGRALTNISKKKKRGTGFKHPAELQTESLPQLSSVTEENSITEFFSLAQLANADYTAQRNLPQIVEVSEGAGGVLSTAKKRHLEQLHEDKRSLLRIPRRPAWDESTTKAELLAREESDFLEWRRRLAELEKEEDLILTPFEKNLEFWRQLWRVTERSDCVVQILDARNPLLFRCEDLDDYVRGLSPGKTMCLLANKSDLLNAKQREHWADYFSRLGVRVIFWSAKLEGAKVVDKDTGDQPADHDNEIEEEIEDISEGEDIEADKHVEDDVTEPSACQGASSSINSPRLVSAQELLSELREHHLIQGGSIPDSGFTVGLIGYPNVGKSSTLNAILNAKRVPVSATPGRTKHFQTFHIPVGDSSVQLCDCPGLVMPSFAFSKAHLTVSGILPVDNMRDYFSPVAVICDQFSRSTLMSIYGISIPPPPVGDNPDRHPTARELLESYSYMHGYMSAQGLPNCDRAARTIIKDYINGRLLYCHPPPGVDIEDFEPLAGNERIHSRKLQTGRAKVANEKEKAEAVADQLTDLERKLLLSSVGERSGYGFCGKARPDCYGPKGSQNIGRMSKKHGNAKKREKLRRVHSKSDV